MKKFVLGIGGYIGSGKSTVARYFEQLGAFYIDADQVVDELYQPGAEGHRKIYNFFGEEYFNRQRVCSVNMLASDCRHIPPCSVSGKLNRKKLAKLIFNDPKKLRILHALIHPLVTHLVQKKINQSHQYFIVIESTYFEKKYLGKFLSALLWIEAPKYLIFHRITKDRGIERTLFEKIYRIQVKPEKIDYTLSNSGTKKHLKSEVKKLWKKFSNV